MESEEEAVSFIQAYDSLTDAEKEEFSQNAANLFATQIVVTILANVAAALIFPRLVRWLLEGLEKKLLKHAS